MERLPDNHHMGPRAGEHEGHVGPRACEHEGHVGPRAGEHEGHMGPRAGRFYPRLVPISSMLTSESKRDSGAGALVLSMPSSTLLEGVFVRKDRSW